MEKHTSFTSDILKIRNGIIHLFYYSFSFRIFNLASTFLIINGLGYYLFIFNKNIVNAENIWLNILIVIYYTASLLPIKLLYKELEVYEQKNKKISKRSTYIDNWYNNIITNNPKKDKYSEFQTKILELEKQQANYVEIDNIKLIEKKISKIDFLVKKKGKIKILNLKSKTSETEIIQAIKDLFKEYSNLFEKLDTDKFLEMILTDKTFVNNKKLTNKEIDDAIGILLLLVDENIIENNHLKLAKILNIFFKWEKSERWITTRITRIINSNYITNQNNLTQIRTYITIYISKK
ncbi:hypothetical protein [Polaribacter aestuariivivens]|uniref:hypothetical protein n=1 Tax=Polaribacter aestuariivivens TaxID=2304626 RepID=UPI003F49233F